MGTSYYGISTPTDTTCEVAGCQRKGKNHGCYGDGGYHRHGMMHLNGNTLAWVCDYHAAEAQEWWRQAKAEKRYPHPIALKS